MPIHLFDYQLASTYLPEVLAASEPRPTIYRADDVQSALSWRASRLFVQTMGLLPVVDEMNAFVKQCRAQLQA